MERRADVIESEQPREEPEGPEQPRDEGEELREERAGRDIQQLEQQPARWVLADSV